MTPEQMRDASLLELFSLEAEAQTQVLNEGLLALERNRPKPISWKPACAPPIRLKGRANCRGGCWRQRRSCHGGLSGQRSGRAFAPASRTY